MPRTQIKVRLAIVLSAVIAALAVVSSSQSRPIGDPPFNSKRTQPVRPKRVKPLASTCCGGGFPWGSGVHVRSVAEERAE